VSLDDEPDGVVERLHGELFLAAEVVVDAALLDAGGLDELAHRGAGVAPLVEDGRRPLEDQPAGGLALAQPGRRDHGILSTNRPFGLIMRRQPARCNVTWDTAPGSAAVRYRPPRGGGGSADRRRRAGACDGERGIRVRAVRAGIVAGAAGGPLRRRRGDGPGPRARPHPRPPGERVRGPGPRRGPRPEAVPLAAPLRPDPVLAPRPH